jgi:hypothetical protein
MWIRNKNNIMENIDLTEYHQSRDKINRILYCVLNKSLYSYEENTKKTQDELLWFLKELSLN